MASFRLTDEQKSFFDEFGFLVFRQSPEEMEVIRFGANQLRAQWRGRLFHTLQFHTTCLGMGLTDNPFLTMRIILRSTRS